MGTSFSTFDENKTAVDNIQIDPNTVSGDGDMLYIFDVQKPVKIQSSGQYFDSINEAMQEAVSGDIILLGHKEDGYLENINIPAGVTLKGGYNRATWERDLDLYPTKIYIREGVAVANGIVAVVNMNSDTSLEGVELYAKDLEHAIYAKNVSNIRIMNTLIRSTIG